MDKINVLVTGIGGSGHGGQVLKSLRLSTKLVLNIIGTDITRDTSGKHLVDIFYEVPPVSNPLYGDVVFGIIKKHNVRFIFHGSEPELKFLSENREILNHMGVFHPMNSKELITLCMNKFNTYEKLQSLGIQVPRYTKISGLEDVAKIDYYPVVLKLNTASGGSAHVYVAVDREEATLLCQYMLKRGLDIVAQEYIDSPDQEYTIGVNSDNQGNIMGSIAVQRYLTNALSTKIKIRDKGNIYVISSGISQGKIGYFPELQKQAENIAKFINSRGPLNIQCRFLNGQLMLMEINPRLSGTTSLRAMAGYNEPEMMINHYLYGKKWYFEYKEMVIMRSLEEIVIY